MRKKEKPANDFIPTRQSLLSRLKNWDDHESWTLFFDTYWRLIYTTALRAGLTESEAEDVVQDTVLDVSRNMPGFKYDPEKGSFKSWLLRLTSWRVKDQFQKRQRLARLSHGPGAPHPGTDTDPLEKVPDPAGPALEAIWDSEWDRNIMQTAVERVKRKVDPKQFQAFDFYVLRDWPMARVTHALQMNRGWVYLAKHRISQLVRKEVENLKNKPL